MSEQDQLSKNDLYILMESYKNNIQLNTTLLEQQKQLMVMNDTSIQKQKELCNTLDDFIKNISTCSQEILKNNVEIIKKNRRKHKRNKKSISIGKRENSQQVIHSINWNDWYCNICDRISNCIC